MGVIRLTLLAAGAVGVAMAHYGRDENLPTDRIGREPTIAEETIVPVSASIATTVDIDAQPTIVATTNAVARAVQQEPMVPTIAADTNPNSAASQAEEAARQMAAGSIAPLADTPSDASELQNFVVKASAVNLRGGPSTDYGVVGRLTRGAAVVEVAQLDNGWSQIKVEETGKRGFMASRFLVPATQ